MIQLACRAAASEESAMSGGFSSEIEITIFRESLQEKFLISPNEMHRGEGAWSGLQLDERAMLAALLTMSSGHKTSRSRIDKIAAPQKKDAIDRILKTLKAQRFLRVERTNAGGGGKFIWRWTVSMFPFPAEPDVSAGQAMGGFSGDGQAEDVSAGQAMTGSTTDGSTTDGSAMHGSPGGHKKYQDFEVPEDPKEQTNTPSADASGAAAAQMTIDGEDEQPAAERQRKRATAKKAVPPKEPRTPTDADEAFGIADGWIKFWADKGTPIVAANPKMALKSLVLPALTSGYTVLEIKRALFGLERQIPSKNQLGDALVAVRQGLPVGRGGANGRGRVAESVNDAWDAQRADPGFVENIPYLASTPVRTTGAAW